MYYPYLYWNIRIYSVFSTFSVWFLWGKIIGVLYIFLEDGKKARALARKWLDLAPSRTLHPTDTLSHTISTFIPHSISHTLCIPPLHHIHFHPLLLYTLFIFTNYPFRLIQFPRYYSIIIYFPSLIFIR